MSSQDIINEIGNSPANKVIKSIMNEDRISLKYFGVKQPDGLAYILDTIDKIQISAIGINRDDLIIESISWRKFENLYALANKLNRVNGKGYVLGLSIYWGLNTSNKLTLIYQPVSLVYEKSEYDLNFKLVNIYKRHDFGEYYKSDGVSTYSTNEFDTLNNEYKRLIGFKASGGNYRLFNEINDIYGDVKSMFFTFQEIFALMHSNTCRVTHLFNSIRIIKNLQNPSSDLVKHTVLFAPEQFGGLPFVELLDSYANLAHLCPPKCPNNSAEYYEYLME